MSMAPRAMPPPARSLKYRLARDGASGVARGWGGAPVEPRACDRGLSALLVSLIRLAGRDFGPFTGAMVVLKKVKQLGATCGPSSKDCVKSTMRAHPLLAVSTRTSGGA